MSYTSQYFKELKSMKNSGCHGNLVKKPKSSPKLYGLELSNLACGIALWPSTKLLQVNKLLVK